jgi:hemoglobin/transferrin/lactoferrin receptor protein
MLVDGSQFSIKTTAFHNDLVNMIETNPLATGGTTNPYKINIGEARIHGIEVEGSFETDMFFTRIAGSIIRGENTDTGEDLTSIPADQLSVTVGGRIVEHGLEFGVRSLFVADIETGSNPGPFDGYNVHNLFLTWKPEFQEIAALDGLELQAGVDNLFDESYQNNLAGDPGKGRDFRVSLAKTFTW